MRKIDVSTVPIERMISIRPNETARAPVSSRFRPRAGRILRIAILATVLAATSCGWVHAKRAAPVEVPPIHIGDVQIEASRDPETMGHVFATNVRTGSKLWERQVYRVFLNPIIEADTQWVFISKMTLEGHLLVIENERGERFELDLRTKKSRRIRKDAK